MKNSVKIIDNTFRRHQVTVVDANNLPAIQEIVGPRVKVGDVLPMKDQKGHIAQDVMELHMEYSGSILQRAIKRSTRWIRNKGLNQLAPRHIAYAMMAHKQADPKGFDKLARS